MRHITGRTTSNVKLLQYCSEPLEQRTEDIDSPQQIGQTTLEHFYTRTLLQDDTRNSDRKEAQGFQREGP